MFSHRTVQIFIRIAFAIVAGLFLVVAARVVLRFGDSSDLPTQGAEVGSMRGGRLLEIYQKLPNGSQEVIGVNSDGSASHALNTVRGSYQFTKTTILPAEVFSEVQIFHNSWCQHSPTFSNQTDTSMVQLRLSCTTLTGKYFYIPHDQVPSIIQKLIDYSWP